MELHRIICKDVLSHVLLPNEPVTDLNDSLRALLLEIKTLHNQEDVANRPAASKVRTCTFAYVTMNNHKLTVP